MEQWIPTLLGFAAASMLYVSVADLIPGLHKRPEPLHSAAQVLLIGLGIASIWGTHMLFEVGALRPPTCPDRLIHDPLAEQPG